MTYTSKCPKMSFSTIEKKGEDFVKGRKKQSTVQISWDSLTIFSTEIFFCSLGSLSFNSWLMIRMVERDDVVVFCYGTVISAWVCTPCSPSWLLLLAYYFFSFLSFQSLCSSRLVWNYDFILFGKLKILFFVDNNKI